jgi:hypothetical protein
VPPEGIAVPFASPHYLLGFFGAGWLHGAGRGAGAGAGFDFGAGFSPTPLPILVITSYFLASSWFLATS